MILINQLIADYIQERLTTNSAHYLDFNPAEPDNAIIYTITPSFPPDPKHEYDVSSVQIIVRAQDPHVARTNMWNLYNALHGLHGITLSGIYIVDTLAVQPPFSLGFDPQNRPQLGINFLIQHDRIV